MLQGLLRGRGQLGVFDTQSVGAHDIMDRFQET